MRHLFFLAILFFSWQSARSSQIEIDRTPSQSQIELLQNESATNYGITDSSSIRELPAFGLTIIKYFEHWEPTAYDDPSGYCTIGYGHLIGKSLCKNLNLGYFGHPLSPADGEILLDKDTAIARKAIQRLVIVDINDNEFGALVSFVFNIGLRNFENSLLLELLNSGNRYAASKQFGRWIKSNGKVLNGLIVRRSCEALLFRSEISPTDGQIDASICTTLGAADANGTLLNIETGAE